MADDFVKVALDGAGKAVDATTETTGAGTVERQRVSVAGAGNNNGLAIDGAGKIGVNNFPATQAVSVAVGSEVDGHSATIGTTTDTSATNTVIGRLKALVAAFAGGLPAALAASGGLKVDIAGTGANATAIKTDGSAVTQPISATNLDVALSTRLKPADTLAGVTTVAAVTAITNALPAGTNKLGTVDIATAAATAKGTQGANGVPTQDLKDSGRTAVVLFLDAVAGITTEALATMSITKGGVAQTAAASYTVTAGKTLRISGIHTTVKNTSTVASDSRVRIRQAAASLAVSSPIILLNEAGSPAAIAQAAGTDDTVIPDGYEVAGGQQIGISHIESATTCTISVTVIGYEY